MWVEDFHKVSNLDDSCCKRAKLTPQQRKGKTWKNGSKFNPFLCNFLWPIQFLNLKFWTSEEVCFYHIAASNSNSILLNFAQMHSLCLWTPWRICFGWWSRKEVCFWSDSWFTLALVDSKTADIFSEGAGCQSNTAAVQRFRFPYPGSMVYGLSHQ